MSRLLVVAKYWLPLLLWMLLIFGVSSDSGSAAHSSRIIGPIVRWLFPRMPEPQVEAIVLGVRKCAHPAEFAVLAWLLWRALWKPVRHDPRPWSWPVARRAVLLVMLYAASDEWHQTFVPSRQGTVRDVALDTFGAAVGVGLAWWVARWRKNRRDRRAAGG